MKEKEKEKKQWGVSGFVLDEMLENAEQYEKEREKLGDDNWEQKDKLRDEMSSKNLAVYLKDQGVITNEKAFCSAMEAWVKLKRSLSSCL